MRGNGAAFLLVIIYCFSCAAGGITDSAVISGEKEHRVLSSTSHEDPNRDLPPLVLELPPEAERMTGEEVYYVGEQLLMRGQSLQAAAFLARAAGLCSIHAYLFVPLTERDNPCVSFAVK